MSLRYWGQVLPHTASSDSRALEEMSQIARGSFFCGREGCWSFATTVRRKPVPIPAVSSGDRYGNGGSQQVCGSGSTGDAAKTVACDEATVIAPS